MLALPITFLPYINFALIGLVLLGVLVGYRRGFILSVLDVMGLLLALWVANRFAAQVAQAVPLVSSSELTVQWSYLGLILLQHINTVLWFFILFALVNLSYLLLRPLFKAFNKLPLLGGLNQILGAVFGGLKWVFYLWIISLVLSTPFFSNGHVFVDNSLLNLYQSIDLQLPEFKAMDLQLFEKVLRNEALNVDEEQLLKQWFESMMNQETIKSQLEAWWRQGLLDQDQYERFQSWVEGLQTSESFDAWWETIKP